MRGELEPIWKQFAETYEALRPAPALDALWFAIQMVRHSAYHLGQINVYLLLWEGEGEP